MATVNLLPNADVTNSPAWTLSTGSDIWALLDDDVTGTPSGEAKQITGTAAGKVCTLAFTDFDETGVTIDSVQPVIICNNNGRGQSYEIKIQIMDDTGSTYYTEGTGTVSASIGWLTKTLTARTTSDGSSAWTNHDLDYMRMRYTLQAHSGGTSRIGYAFLIVTYTEAVAADNAIFFGTNF